MNVIEALEAWSRRKPAADAVTFLDGQGRIADRLSFGALWREIGRTAAALRSAGCSGQRLLLPAESSRAFICALYGAMVAGALPVPVPVSSRPRAIARLGRIAEDAGAVRAIALQPGSALAAALPHLEWLDLAGGGEAGDHTGADPCAAPEATALLQYTSGSTTQPKGVVVTHGNLAANLAMLRSAMAVDEHSRILTWLPMHHDMGLVGQLLLAMSSGASLTLISPLSFVRRPELWLRAIAAQQATLSGAPNFAYDLVNRRASAVPDDCDLSSWRLAFCGAEKVRPTTLRAFADRFSSHGFDAAALFPCYGLAEATVFVSGGPAGRGLKTAPAPGSGIEVASCGIAAGLVAVVDPDTLLPVGEGSEGEIWLSGSHVTRGYQDAQGTSSFDARIKGGDDVSHLRTGDMGFMSNGELYVTGRLKDLIVHQGENIHPEDVEATIRESGTGVGSVGAAFAIDQDGGEQVIALVEVERGADAEAMKRMIREGMIAVADAHALRLDDLILVAPGTLARTTSGKVRRLACRAMYLDGSFAPLMSYRGSRPAAAAVPPLVAAES